MIPDSELLRGFEGMYTDGDADIRCYSAKVIVTRKPHKCPGNFLEALHDIPAGTRTIRETAIVDGHWGTSYTCEKCVIEWGSNR